MSPHQRMGWDSFFSPLPRLILSEAEYKDSNRFALLNRRIHQKNSTYAQVVFTLYKMPQEDLKTFEAERASDFAKPLIQFANIGHWIIGIKKKMDSGSLVRRKAEEEIKRSEEISLQVADLRKQLDKLKDSIQKTGKINEKQKNEIQELKTRLNTLKETRGSKKIELERWTTKLKEIQQKRSK